MTELLSLPPNHACSPAPISGDRERAPLVRSMRYIAVAAVCALINNLLLIALVKAGFGYFIGIWLAFVPMVLLGYALHASVTFAAPVSLVALLRYSLAMLANYPLWIVSLVILCDALKLPIVIAAPAGTAIAFIGNYIGAHWAILRSARAAFGMGRPPEGPIDRNLLVEFLQEYAFQPATAFWRAIELPALIDLAIPTGRGLDVGCGDGKLSAILLRHIGDRELVGVDPDPREAAEAERRKVYASVHSCGGGVIPEPDCAFDFAISNSVLEHIPALDPVLAETARVLCPNALFCLTVPHAGFHAQLRGPLLLGVGRAEYEARLDKRLAHLRYPTAAEWRAMLERHGFAVEKMGFYLNRAEVRRWETVSRMTAGLLSALSGGRLHPIALQRRLGLRQVQNRRTLPLPIASAVAAMLSLGLRQPSQPTEANTGCVAIRCRRVGAA